MPVARDERHRRRRAGSRLVYADSIAPVLSKAVLWENSFRIDDNLVLEAGPGRTPGSSPVRLSSGSDRAVFVGDLVHSPVQFLEDPVTASATRRRVLERAADTAELIIPAHFAGPGAAEIRREGDKFTVSRWAQS
ncbi:MBL fold metallo-hydrolase [Nocardia callitridis]|uniref:Metallo-beta-lactamase domain-containing protein n=1 Tax=Nocardia callitridis TaxID=648753 RepID=A0ABP9KNY5_9NOCA